ncbi:hypothetical protein Aab01nite_77570 [Paractinoplanes abujensis]|uniref:DUF998 domain-containing protein n=1 Tax=Paractinoplanes abujensis TaxID=882441 RepID=A0A7W7CPI0_9ACTN|nr:hypothetical protein [Actinoplanes abujensis]MBB4692355.1 hypothetical protein [Actinoplanes abujensis]GID24167.1 hypothetical protein Aab01nite_77570 [Actinoplanes abujensis]
MTSGLWALPAYGILLALSTLTHQPSIDDFDAYARYVTTGTFLLSHLAASIFGAALAILGTAAATTHLKSKIPYVLTVIANVFLAATFGSAAFVQPGLGRAHLAGVPGMPALNNDTAYGPAFIATALSASVLLIVAALALGTATARTRHDLRAPGIAYGILLSLFTVSGFAYPAAQAYVGFAFAAAAAVLAYRLPRTTAAHSEPALTSA